jgi:small-conductance mechanosensitive channel
VAGAAHDVSEQWRWSFGCIGMARFGGLFARRERRCLQLLLASLLVLLLPLGWSPPAPAADPPPPGPRSAWVTLDGRPVLEIRSAPGAQTPEAFARRASSELTALAENPTIAPEQLVVREDPPYSMVGLLQPEGRFTPKLAVDDRAARAFDLPRPALAERYRDQLRGAIRQYRSSHSLGSWLRGTALAALMLGIYVLWLRAQLRFNGWLTARIDRSAGRRGGLWIGSTQLLGGSQVAASLQWLRRGAHWSLLLLASYLLIPLLLGFFPPTQVIAEGLRGQILGLALSLLQAVIGAIPNLISIALILVITGLVMRASQAWFRELARGRLRIPGFYPEWAVPTSRIVSGLILLAGLVIAFPYLPGSGSKIFQGAGLFLGVLAALGSSAVSTNIISGLMLIYTRAFREGDRVELNGVVGVVQDQDLLVTRIQTPRNELVSIPNATVIASSIVNFSFSRREIRQPVALATTITIGYDVPWRQVHALMLAAARSVPGITDETEPFVLQTALNDFHISYELNAFVRDVGTYRQSLSDLLAAIQDQFAAADVEILSPGYHAIRNGNRSTVPKAPPA